MSISSAWKGENHMDFSWSSITSANTYVVLQQNDAKGLFGYEPQAAASVHSTTEPGVNFAALPLILTWC